MTIITLQRRLHEAGRIRLGEKVAMGAGKSLPSRLDSFRFTSQNEGAIKAIAAIYGGTPPAVEGHADRQAMGGLHRLQ